MEPVDETPNEPALTRSPKAAAGLPNNEGEEKSLPTTPVAPTMTMTSSGVPPSGPIVAAPALRTVSPNSSPGQGDAQELPNLVGYNSQGLPIRKGVPICYHWRKSHECTDSNCKFTHPEVVAATPSTTLSELPTPPASIAQKKTGVHPAKSPASLELEAVNAVHSWLRRNGSEVLLSSMSAFYKAYPKYAAVFSGKSKPILEKYPEKFWIWKAEGQRVYVRALPFEPGLATVAAVKHQLPTPAKPVAQPNKDHIPQQSKDPEQKSHKEEIATTVEGSHRDRTAKIEEWRLKGGFDDRAVRLLIDFILSQPDKRMCKTLLGNYYIKHPEYDYIFSKRIPELLATYPDALHLVKEGGREYLTVGDPSALRPLKPVKTSTGPKVQTQLESVKPTAKEAPVVPRHLAEDETIKKAFYELGRFVSELPGKRLPAIQMQRFYTKYPQYRKVFVGKFKDLAKLYPDALRIGADEPIIFFANDHVEQDGQPQLSQGLNEEEEKQNNATRAAVNVNASKPIAIPSLHGVPYTTDSQQARDVLRSWIPFDTLGVEVAGDELSGEITAIMIVAEGHKKLLIDCAAKGAKTMLTSSGLEGILADENVPKVCLDATRLAFMLYRSSGLALSPIMDLKAADQVLTNKQDSSSLVQLLERYKITIPFHQQKARLSHEDWMQRPLTLKHIQWIRFFAEFLLVISKDISADAIEKELFRECVEASDAAVRKGIWLAAHLTKPATRPLIQENIASGTAKLTKVGTAVEPAKQAAPVTVKKTTIKTTTPFDKAAAQQKQKERQEILRSKNLPPNACFSYFVATPGKCKIATCRYLHDLPAGNKQPRPAPPS